MDISGIRHDIHIADRTAINNNLWKHPAFPQSLEHCGPPEVNSPSFLVASQSQTSPSGIQWLWIYTSEPSRYESWAVRQHIVIYEIHLYNSSILKNSKVRESGTTVGSFEPSPHVGHPQTFIFPGGNCHSKHGECIAWLTWSVMGLFPSKQGNPKKEIHIISW